MDTIEHIDIKEVIKLGTNNIIAVAEDGRLYQGERYGSCDNYVNGRWEWYDITPMKEDFEE